MPEGKDFIKDFLLDKNIKRILDVGPGSGNYFDLLSPHIDCEWVGVEIYPLYLDMFNLRGKYSTLIFTDIYDLDWESLDRFDAIIFGDVIEHMGYSRAQEVLAKAIDYGTWLVLSLPIVEFPQGASYGNEHEAHVETYSPERVRELLAPYNLVAAFDGEIVGAYIFTK